MDFWDSYYMFLSFRKLGYRTQISFVIIIHLLLFSTISTFRLFLRNLHCDSHSFYIVFVSEKD